MILWWWVPFIVMGSSNLNLYCPGINKVRAHMYKLMNSGSKMYTHCAGESIICCCRWEWLTIMWWLMRQSLQLWCVANLMNTFTICGTGNLPGGAHLLHRFDIIRVCHTGRHLLGWLWVVRNRLVAAHNLVPEYLPFTGEVICTLIWTVQINLSVWVVIAMCS